MPATILRLRYRRRSALLAGASLAAVVLCTPAAATFAGEASAAHTISSATLAAPTGLAAANGLCLVGTSIEVELSWTATVSTFADGYEIFRSTASGGPYSLVGSAAGQATTSYSDATVGFSTTYYYVVRSTRNEWRSADSSEAVVTTLSSFCL